MIELLKKHIENLRNDFDKSGMNVNPIRPYLKENVSLDAKSFILPERIPDFLNELVQIMESQDIDTRIRSLAGAVYSYVFNPFDIIPDQVGYLGFIDDAMIVIYGLKKIEEILKHTKFTSINSEVKESLQCWENALSTEVIIALREYILNIQGILNTTKFPESEKA